MLWPYARAATTRSEPALIDRWTPPGAWMVTRHVIELPVGPETALAQMASVPLRDVPVVTGLLALRGMPATTQQTVLDFFGSRPFRIVDREHGREFVFVLVWRFRRGPSRVPATPEELRAAISGGRMAAIGNFRVEPTGAGSRLWTETWVAAQGTAQVAVFTAYWLAIGPFSAWIRRILLRAGRERAAAARR